MAAGNPKEPLGIEAADQLQSSQGDETVDLLLSSIWLAVVIWLIVRAFQQRDLLQSLKPAEPPPSDRAPKVAVIIPARDGPPISTAGCAVLSGKLIRPCVCASS